MELIFKLILIRPTIYALDYFVDGLNILLAIIILSCILFQVSMKKILNKLQWSCILIFGIITIKGFLYNYGR